MEFHVDGSFVELDLALDVPPAPFDEVRLICHACIVPRRISAESKG